MTIAMPNSELLAEGQVFAGIDWSEKKHDYAIVDGAGHVVVRGQFPDTLDGLRSFLAAIDSVVEPDTSVPIAIETDRSLLVDELRRTRHRVVPINPRKAVHYRGRHTTSGGKSDKTDAVMLANIPRTDGHVHHQLPSKSQPLRALNQVARAHDDAGMRTRKIGNEFRSLLRLYYPGALRAFTPTQLVEPWVLQVLLRVPTPSAARLASVDDIADAMRAGGRTRLVTKTAATVLEKLQAPEMTADPAVEETHGQAVVGLAHTLLGTDQTAKHLQSVLETQMVSMGYDKVVKPIPGMGLVLGARILSEIGDDLSRFVDAKALKSYAGTSPITTTSGKQWGTRVRRVCNRRLQHSAYLWAQMAMFHSQGARDHYDRKREQGKRHSEAVRHLSNKMIGCLFHCLVTGEAWSEVKVFGKDERRSWRPKKESMPQPDDDSLLAS